MKLIVGLGNPGSVYGRTRHNVGFMFLDHFAYQTSVDEHIPRHQFTTQKSFDASVLELRTNHAKILLAKPGTFMNRSGIAVRKLKDYYKMAINDIIVVHDDLDIPLGQVKIQQGKGPKVHNGISSVEQMLGSNEFWRVRIGVENRPRDIKISGETYVLSPFRNEEEDTVQSVFRDITARLRAEHLKEQ